MKKHQQHARHELTNTRQQAPTLINGTWVPKCLQDVCMRRSWISWDTSIAVVFDELPYKSRRYLHYRSRVRSCAAAATILVNHQSSAWLIDIGACSINIWLDWYKSTSINHLICLDQSGTWLLRSLAWAWGRSQKAPPEQWWRKTPLMELVLTSGRDYMVALVRSHAPEMASRYSKR
jgi:hypothetical protein